MAKRLSETQPPAVQPLQQRDQSLHREVLLTLAEELRASMSSGLSVWGRWVYGFGALSAGLEASGL